MFGVFDSYNNRMFDCKSFASYDKAWEYIDLMFPCDLDLCDLEARPLNQLTYGFSEE